MKRLVLTVHTSFFLFWLVSYSHVLSALETTPRTAPAPFLIWDNDPNTYTVMATFCCDGPVTEELVRPYIPEAQVWGDGRFLWTEQDDDGVRQVMVKQSTTGGMTELLREIASSSFFDWNEHYVGEPVVDAISQCLTVTSKVETKTVCATHGGATDTFNALFGWLSQGAGMNGVQNWPERVYQTGFQLVDTVTLLPEPDAAWPESLAHVPVGEAINGLWLDEGETLGLLWEATNRNLFHMSVVDDGDGCYRLILQVPGVSWIAP